MVRVKYESHISRQLYTTAILIESSIKSFFSGKTQFSYQRHERKFVLAALNSWFERSNGKVRENEEVCENNLQFSTKIVFIVINIAT